SGTRWPSCSGRRASRARTGRSRGTRPSRPGRPRTVAGRPPRRERRDRALAADPRRGVGPAVARLAVARAVRGHREEAIARAATAPEPRPRPARARDAVVGTAVARRVHVEEPYARGQDARRRGVPPAPAQGEARAADEF